MDTSTDTADSSNSITRVLLQDATAFEKALERYVDENKPDPLQLRQIQSWELQWTDDTTASAVHDDDNAFRASALGAENEKDDTFLKSASFTHVLSGRLTIRGEYVSVTLHSSCWWTDDNNDNDADAASSSFLLYQCQASAQLNGLNETTQQDRKQKKIHQQMRKRLLSDDYIAKLLVAENERTNKLPQVCQARIYQSNDTTTAFVGGGLEERVHCHQDVAEGIRRAVFSTADSTLDVFDLVVNLPSLPAVTTTASDGNATTAATTRLANRAKLRLLEDAKCDACEQEGEEELVGQLELKDHDAASTDNNNNNKSTPKQPKSKKSRTTK